jgi:hypothetical protein
MLPDLTAPSERQFCATPTPIADEARGDFLLLQNRSR